MTVATVDLPPPRVTRCSIATLGGKPSTRSTSGFSSCSTNCRAYGDMLSRNLRCPSAKRMSNASVDFPEPLMPVITTIWSRGIFTEMFFRLCSRAPWIAIAPFVPGLGSARRWRAPFGALAEWFFCGAQPERFLIVSVVAMSRDSFRRAAENSTRAACAPQNFAEKFAGVRLLYLRDLLRRSKRDHFATLIAGFRSKIDNPICAFDDFEVVLDDHDRMSAIDQSLKQLEQHRDVIEMQTGRRLVEDKKIANCDRVAFRWTLSVALSSLLAESFRVGVERFPFPTNA